MLNGSESPVVWLKTNQRKVTIGKEAQNNPKNQRKETIMEDWQAEMLALYASIAFVLLDRVNFAINNMSEEYGRKELDWLQKIKDEVEI